MPREIFISYSTGDREIADELCKALESAGLSCWLAPRNIEPGSNWTASIMSAIAECRVMALIFSSKSNESAHVTREILHAVEKGRQVIPIRIEEVVPTGGLAYCLVGVQWFDATTKPVSSHAASLVAQMRLLLQRSGDVSAVAGQAIEQPGDIHFQCGKCGQRLVTDASAAGQSIQCPSCETEIVIPKADESPHEKLGAAPEKNVRNASPPASALLDSAAIADLKAKLATFVGPVAKVLVDRAISRSSSVSELLEMLASEIDYSDDRKKFLSSVASVGRGR